MHKRMNTLLWVGMVGTLFIGTSLLTNVYQAFWGDQTIWWTPPSMQLPFEETRDRFELSIAGVSLWKHLSQGTILAVDSKGNQFPVVARDITVRLNNWEKVRASLLVRATWTGAAFGVLITLFVLGLIRAFRPEKPSSQPAA